jgi:hypothetical protein
MLEHIPTQKKSKHNHQTKRDKKLKRKHDRKYQKINVKKSNEKETCWKF